MEKNNKDIKVDSIDPKAIEYFPNINFNKIKEKCFQY
jgi:hypothetical protein